MNSSRPESRNKKIKKKKTEGILETKIQELEEKAQRQASSIENKRWKRISDIENKREEIDTLVKEIVKSWYKTFLRKSGTL